MVSGTVGSYVVPGLSYMQGYSALDSSWSLVWSVAARGLEVIAMRSSSAEYPHDVLGILFSPRQGWKQCLYTVQIHVSKAIS